MTALVVELELGSALVVRMREAKPCMGAEDNSHARVVLYQLRLHLLVRCDAIDAQDLIDGQHVHRKFALQGYVGFGRCDLPRGARVAVRHRHVERVERNQATKTVMTQIDPENKLVRSLCTRGLLVGVCGRSSEERELLLMTRAYGKTAHQGAAACHT